MMDEASIASVILAVVAIALSMSFFWMSYNASKNIESSVDKLEKIYDVLLNKMFGMVGETLADYRKHAWSGNVTEEDLSKLAEEKADRKFEEVRSRLNKEMEAKITELNLKTEKTDAEISGIKTSMEKILEKAIAESRHVEEEIKSETLIDMVLIGIMDLNRLSGANKVRVGKLMAHIARKSRTVIDDAFILKILIYLRDIGLILLSFGINRWNDIHSTTLVELTTDGLMRAREIENDTHMGKYVTNE